MPAGQAPDPEFAQHLPAWVAQRVAADIKELLSERLRQGYVLDQEPVIAWVPRSWVPPALWVRLQAIVCRPENRKPTGGALTTANVSALAGCLPPVLPVMAPVGQPPAPPRSSHTGRSRPEDWTERVVCRVATPESPPATAGVEEAA
jgi:hypothetical protein